MLKCMKCNKNKLNLNNPFNFTIIINDLYKICITFRKKTFYIIISEQICIFMTNNMQLSLERFKIIRLYMYNCSPLKGMQRK